MLKFLIPFIVTVLFCIPSYSADYAPGKLSNNTPVAILTWSNGIYTVCPPGQSVGHGNNGVVDCDWYYNPYTGMWVKITPTDTYTTTITPIVNLTEEDENYVGVFSPQFTYPFVVPVEPSLILTNGPGTPWVWSEVPYEYLPILIPVSAGADPENFDSNVGISQ